jgi:hypothetical protein
MRWVGSAIACGSVICANACLEPTEIIVEIHTNARCSDIRDTAIVVARPGMVAATAPVANAMGCKEEGRIGSIVILRGAASILEVTTGFSRNADDCRAKPGLGCIVSRRDLRFIPNRSLRITIDQDVDCSGVPCDTEVATCERGTCVPISQAGADGGPTKTCPSSGRGPVMVAVGGYCIDSTEVSNDQYAAFLATNPTGAGGPTPCGWKQDHQPHAGQTWMGGSMPQTGVDWCDAYSFCAWAGKRLCGLRPGAPAGRIDVIDRAHDEWYLACAGPAMRVFPYGDTYQSAACTNVDKAPPQPLPVGSLKSCEGGYPGVFDLSGNVQEWRGICSGTTSNDRCLEGSGSFKFDKTDPIGRSRCDGGMPPDTDLYPFYNNDSGIRCCADLGP